jgi:endonuclease YncB( thermonuclease family)
MGEGMIKPTTLALAATLVATGATVAQTGAIEVVDGDTVKVDDVSWRLEGYDCPETYYARCPSERAQGDAATRRLQQLLDGAKKIDLLADRHVDRYGRQLGHLPVDGRDVGEILVREGLCVPYSGHTKRRDWCGP